MSSSGSMRIDGVNVTSSNQRIVVLATLIGAAPMLLLTVLFLAVCGIIVTFEKVNEHRKHKTKMTEGVPTRRQRMSSPLNELVPEPLQLEVLSTVRIIPARTYSEQQIQHDSDQSSLHTVISFSADDAQEIEMIKLAIEDAMPEEYFK
ncbi:hypothetical protein ACOME3_005666 [Neoechinorhynchus agilis]